MPTLSVTVTSPQATRAMAALGHWRVVNGFTTNEWVPATAQQVQDWILARLHETTVQYEHQLAQQADLNTRQAEVW